MRVLLLFLSVIITLKAADVVSNDEDYFKSTIGNTQLIHTEQNLPSATQAATLGPLIEHAFEQSYGFELDSTLYVGLISQNNQIANGFSTQFPLNKQINYIGGTSRVDYFTSTSWLRMLLYHESAHNYQLNPKKSTISRVGHDYLGNTGFTFFFFPFFTVPNLTESSFLLEGNAVLNESWNGNGGRLYSGRFKAETLLQAAAGQITPERLYNANYFFPYGDQFYIIGGFFQLYLAERFGLDRTNRYFWNHSGSWLWPFRTNHIFQQTFGINFETALSDYNLWLLKQYEGFEKAKGKEIAASQYFSSLNADKDELFFLISDRYRAPELLKLSKSSGALSHQRESYRAGKVLNVDGRYYTQSGAYTNPTKIYQGLFDDTGHIVEGTASKMIQGYLSDGKAVYFDVPSSFDQPQLYVGDTFYAQVNSSVYIDRDDNLYYFVQKGKKRTLYKNRAPLFVVDGYYGIVSDVDSKGRIYFIANSEHGSSLYRYDRGEIERVNGGDNIVEARLVNDDKVLLATIGSDAYHYLIASVDAQDEAPYDMVHFFESEPYFDNKMYLADINRSIETEVNLDENYTPLLDMHYSALFPWIGYSSDKGVLFNFSAVFADPLSQNSASVFIERNLNEVTLAGVSYNNSQSILNFGVSAYGVLESGDTDNTRYYMDPIDQSPRQRDVNVSDRGFGVSAYARLELLKMGYISSDVTLSYYLDYDSNAREPASLTWEIAKKERYGTSMFNNFVNQLALYGTVDRGDTGYGGTYDFQHDLPYEFYLGFGAQYSTSDAKVNIEDPYDRGIKLTAYQNQFVLDPSTIIMPAIDTTRYIKEGAVAEASLKKVFNGSFYFFTFPVSLRREAFYLKYRYYDIEDFNTKTTIYHEQTLGLTADTLWMNKMPIPFGLEYIHNDNTKDEHHLRFTIGLVF